MGDQIIKLNNLINKEIEAIQNIPVDDNIIDAVNLIHHHVHDLKGKLVVCGMGKAGQIGNNIATTFSSTGTAAVFLHPSEAQHGDLGIIQPNDILLLISNSGKTREIVELNGLVKQLFDKLPIIGLTGNPEGELAGFADTILLTGAPQEICPLGLTPTTSTTVMTVVGDLLVVLLMEKIKFTKQDYAIRHHSGYLGQKANKL